MLELKGVSKITNHKTIVNQVSFNVHQGKTVGLIGPNGAGKSTLIKLISAFEKPTQGEIEINKVNVLNWPIKKLARHVAVLNQGGLESYPISVFDAVLMGRYPHIGFLKRESQQDYDMVEDVLEKTSLIDLRNQSLDTLSGGERQRVAIAKAMVQQPELLLLDEPTTYLDIGHQMNILQIVRDWQKREGITVLMVLHDLNLAAQFCDKLILMQQGEIIKQGSNEEVLSKDMLNKVYRANPEIIRHPRNNIPQILL